MHNMKKPMKKDPSQSSYHRQAIAIETPTESSKVHMCKTKEVSLLKTPSTKRKKTFGLGLKKKRIITWRECFK